MLAHYESMTFNVERARLTARNLKRTFIDKGNSHAERADGRTLNYRKYFLCMGMSATAKSV